MNDKQPVFKKRLATLLALVVDTFSALPDDAIVAALDKDADGEISYEELLTCVQTHATTFNNRAPSDEDMAAVWMELDADSNGGVSVSELLARIRDPPAGHSEL